MKWGCKTKQSKSPFQKLKPWGFKTARVGHGSNRGDLQADVTTRTGLLQVDSSQVDNQQNNWDFVYRYAAPPYELVLKIEKLQPRVSAEEYVDILASRTSYESM